MKNISQNFSRLGVSARKNLNKIPHRIDLAGGFFDQKKFNSVTPGSSVILNLEPMNLEPRSGMASSTRRVIQELFGMSLPANQPLEKSPDRYLHMRTSTKNTFLGLLMRMDLFTLE